MPEEEEFLAPPPVPDPEDLDVDHEEFAGEETADPWDDPTQTDWPDAPPMIGVEG